MKRTKLWVLALAFLSVLACDKEELAIDLAFEDAEIIGRDATRWICGGGWFIVHANDTFTVQSIPNQEILDMVNQDAHVVLPPLKVWVAFENAPTSTCALEFSDQVKEIRAIELRED